MCYSIVDAIKKYFLLSRINNDDLVRFSLYFIHRIIVINNIRIMIIMNYMKNKIVHIRNLIL
jgi:hypothetical protein